MRERTYTAYAVTISTNDDWNGNARTFWWRDRGMAERFAAGNTSPNGGPATVTEMTIGARQARRLGVA